MIPFVLGGIALAAVGYKVLKYCDEEGCPSDEKVATRTNNNPSKEFKKSNNTFHEAMLLRLEEVLRQVEGSKHRIDEPIMAKEEAYKEDVVLRCLVEEMGEEAYLRSCTKMLEKACEFGDFYTMSIKNLLKEDRDINSFSKAEKKMLKYAVKFYNAMQVLLNHTSVSEEGVVVISTSKAFLLYKEVLAKHKMKVSLFRAGRENYALYLTSHESKVFACPL